MLQTWLQAAIANPSLRKPLSDFLGISDCPVPQPPLITEEEQCVLDFISKVETNSRMKLSWLASLDSALFVKKPRIRLEYIRKLVDLLTLLCADHIAGCKAICILHKLTSRECYREHDTVVHEWLCLGPDRLRSMGLDLHLLQQMYADTREEAFHMFKLVHDTWMSMGRTFLLRVVNSRQLNDNLEAYSLFERWVENKLEVGATVAKEMAWRRLESEVGSPDLCVYFRFIEDYVELKVGMRVAASCDRVARCIMEPEQRVKWDANFDFRRANEKPTEGKMDFNCEISGLSIDVLTDFKLTRQWPNRICIDFRSREDPSVSTKPSYLSRYILIPGSHRLPSTPTETARTHFPQLKEPSPIGLNEGKMEPSEPNTLMKYYVLMCRSLAKAYLPDLLGESDKLIKGYLSLKRYAEEDAQSPLRTLNEAFLFGAVERKALTPTHQKRVKKRINLKTMTVDDHAGDTRLARRMFE